MEIDPSHEKSAKLKAEVLQRLAAGTLRSSIAKVSGSSRGMPSEKDFHFYYNFDEYKVPIDRIEKSSGAVLEEVGESSHLLGKELAFQSNDSDDGYDWLVNVNDEVLERLDMSIDEFHSLRKKEEETGVRIMNQELLEDGFRMVYGKKSKKVSQDREPKIDERDSIAGVKVGSRAGMSKPKVPFHIPSIPRPQDVYKIVVNNANEPFTHVWLPKSEDGLRFVHPLEMVSVLDFVDKDVMDVEPEKPPPLESTPFKLVEEVKDLKALAAKLRDVNEFAVDLEHNQYRSFQGLTCLMQISTRSEDYIVDTLKLRIHIGPYLREVFKDPSKRKVMHGADRDVVWLQRDFGIYVCNLFDTGQASKVLKLERNSLEHLLSHFCGVVANKEYQNADWRLRPLPHEMVKYAREDTHYLLYIYDVMRRRLLSSSLETEDSDTPLTEVYKRSYDVCMQIYEKELLSSSSYLYIYGLQNAGLSAQQLAVVSGLHEWRDAVARSEDESTGYILPNKALIEIAKQMPLTANKLHKLVKWKHPYLERNLGSVVNIIRHSVQNAAAFEAAVEQLRERCNETTPIENRLGADGSNAPLPGGASASVEMTTTESSGCGHTSASASSGTVTASVEFAKVDTVGNKDDTDEGKEAGFFKHSRENGNVNNSVIGVTVQVSKKPTGGLGALLGTTSKRKHPDKKEEDVKLQQIKSSVNLPFHSFLGSEQQQQQQQLQSPERDSKQLRETLDCTEPAASNLEDVIVVESESDMEESLDGDAPVVTQGTVPSLGEIVVLESDSDIDEAPPDQPANCDQVDQREQKGDSEVIGEDDDDHDDICLSDLSSSFQKCLQSSNQARKVNSSINSQEAEGLKLVKPFDYKAARERVKFGVDNVKVGNNSDPRSRKRSSLQGSASQKDGGSNDNIAAGRRRQAFPASGNRSATFR